MTAEVSGTVDWLNNKVDLVADVNLKGLVGVATTLIRPLKSGFIELRGTGKLGEVKWERATILDPKDKRKSLLRPFREEEE